VSPREEEPSQPCLVRVRVRVRVGVRNRVRNRDRVRLRDRLRVRDKVRVGVGVRVRVRVRSRPSGARPARREHARRAGRVSGGPHSRSRGGCPALPARSVRVRN